MMPLPYMLNLRPKYNVWLDAVEEGLNHGVRGPQGNKV